jgi:hypothetical protein
VLGHLRPRELVEATRWLPGVRNEQLGPCGISKVRSRVHLRASSAESADDRSPTRYTRIGRSPSRWSASRMRRPHCQLERRDVRPVRLDREHDASAENPAEILEVGGDVDARDVQEVEAVGRRRGVVKPPGPGKERAGSAPSFEWSRRSADPRLMAEMLIGLLAPDPNVFYIGIKPRREPPVPTPVT